MASILPLAVTQFFSQDGVPLAGGKVYFFIPATTTPKDTWTDSGQTTLNTNPVLLDAGGEAIIYGAGSYRQQVFDADGNLIWDQITAGTSAGRSPPEGTISGDETVTTPGLYLLSLSASVTITLPTSPDEGDTFSFKDSAGTLSPSVSATFVAGGTLFDGVATYVMSFAYQCENFYFNGTSYSVI